MRKICKAALLLMAGLYAGSAADARPAENELDILSIMLPILATRCDEDKLASCSSRIGCRRADGAWEQGVCSVKPPNRKSTERLAGRWHLLTIFPDGNNKSYFWNDLSSVKAVYDRTRTADSEDYSIQGLGHLTSAFNTPNPVYVTGAYDSSRQDWFFLEVWGRDVASLYEFTFTNAYRISGCEYLVSYPDSRYLTGTCNSFTGTNVTTYAQQSVLEGETVVTDKRVLAQTEIELSGQRAKSGSSGEYSLPTVSPLVRSVLRQQTTQQ